MRVLLFLSAIRGMKVLEDTITVVLSGKGIDKISSAQPVITNTIAQTEHPPQKPDSMAIAYTHSTKTNQLPSAPDANTPSKETEPQVDSHRTISSPEPKESSTTTTAIANPIGVSSTSQKSTSEVPIKSEVSSVPEKKSSILDNNCYVLRYNEDISDKNKSILMKLVKDNGIYIRYTYKNIFNGISLCDLVDPDILNQLNMKYTLEKNKEYSLSYIQHNLPDNYAVILNSQKILFNSPSIDRFFNTYVRNSVLIRKSIFFKWYRGVFQYISSSLTGKGVNIIVLDSDISYIHSDIKDRLSVNRIVESTLDTHSTGVLTAAAGTYTGLAKESNLILYPVFRYGIGRLNDILHVLDVIGDKIDKGKNILLLPFSGEYSDILDYSLKYFYDKSIPVIAAAGNNGKDSCNYSPGRSIYAITAGSITDGLSPEEWSNSGNCVSTYSPGSVMVGKLPTYKRQNTPEYSLEKGTSLSAAYTAGYISVLLQKSTYSISTLKTLLSAYPYKIPPLPQQSSREPVLISPFTYHIQLIDILIVLLIVVLVVLVYIRSRKRRYIKYTPR
ncbi:hypothetical protein NEOKW01_0758 [Nematocida sp. AWRm80]|nr:hypothetical protein NEOKW01_0758 [Nematocida sp. AWRm80]